MKIYTKTGDKGETSLFRGKRVPKDHQRIRAYGTVDELNSVVGWLRAGGLNEDLAQVLEKIQHQLFNIGAELARIEAEGEKGRSHNLTEEDVKLLEDIIDRWGQELQAIQNFFLPGGTEVAARAHIMRTITRRAEREVIALSRTTTVSPVIVKYLNRLSDFAFVLARVINSRAGQADVKWNKDMGSKG